ncbi:hypothetical protein DPMN_095264 [Dreissena polymorpha]|uniref:Uncharacterized protein n=1 Tax=Dreissena polymorpha TaxID=45954 RepID=A0A9D4L904_DREPO|nr:hypothetical protein DPMN_095264 [Dreissena polymorpha]
MLSKMSSMHLGTVVSHQSKRTLMQTPMMMMMTMMVMTMLYMHIGMGTPMNIEEVIDF